MTENELFGNSEQLNDTISRQETVKAIRDAVLAWSSMPQWREDKIVDAVKHLPPAQQERKKGKWIYNSPVTMKCDQCGFVIKDWDWHRFKFCPNCGADMRGEQDE